MIILRRLNDSHPMELRTAPKAWGPAAQPPPKKVAPWAGLGVGFQNQELWKKSAPIVETENKSKMMDFFNIYPWKLWNYYDYKIL